MFKTNFVGIELKSESAKAKNVSSPDFVIVGQEDWDEIWRRNQFLIAGLAERFPSSKFLFVEMPFDFTYGIRSKQLLSASSLMRQKLKQYRQGVRFAANLPNIYVLTALKVAPDALPFGEKLNAKILAGQIRRAMQVLGISQPIFWTQNPFAASLLGQLNEKAVIYDVTDDWAALAGVSERFLERVKKGDAALLQKANCVFTCSEYLYQQKKIANSNTFLVQNGVDTQHYREIGTSDLPIASALGKIARPIIGYTGSLHPARLDVDLIYNLAETYPNYNFVFVGPNFLPTEVTKKLQTFSNVHLLGSVPYADIPKYMQAFDVLMIPHVVSNFTESLNPLKLFEYLAAGLPTVATNVAGFREYDGLFNIAKTQTEFIEAVQKTYEQKAKFDSKVARQLAQEADWQNRVEDVLTALKQVEIYD